MPVVTIQHHQTVSQTTTTTNQTSGQLQFNIYYFCTLRGILKLLQVLFAIIALALAAPALFFGSHFFLFVVATALIVTIWWCFVYLLGLAGVLNCPVSWIKTELITASISTILYAGAVIVQFLTYEGYTGSRVAMNIAAGVFAVINCVLYGLETYFLYKDFRLR